MRTPHRTHRPDGEAHRGTCGIWPARHSAGHGVTGDHLAQARRCPGPRRPPPPAVELAPARTSPKAEAAAGRLAGAPATRPVYRLLLMKGLTPTEAANLTAFICGLSTSDPQLVAQAGQPAAVPAADAPGGPLRRHRRRRRNGRTDPRFQPDSGGTLLPRRDRPPEAAPSLLPAPLRLVRKATVSRGAPRSHLLAAH